MAKDGAPVSSSKFQRTGRKMPELLGGGRKVHEDCSSLRDKCRWGRGVRIPLNFNPRSRT